MKITIIATGFDRKPDDPYYRNQAALNAANTIEQPDEIKLDDTATADNGSVSHKPEASSAEKEVPLDKNMNFENIWDVFKRK